MTHQQNQRFAAFLTFILLLVAIAVVALLGRYASDGVLAIGAMIGVIVFATARAL